MELLLSTGKVGSAPSSRVQMLPFAILPQDEETSQPARVHDFFLVKRDEEAPDAIQASFRGRELKGVALPLPKGFKGVVARVDAKKKHKKRARYSEDEDDEEEDDLEEEEEKKARKGKVTSTFDELVIWNHDTVPHESENPFEWLKWTDFAQKIHTKVSKEELDKRTENAPASK